MPLYQQSPTGARRDTFARFAWGELERDEQLNLMNAAQRVIELRNMGELGLAELLFALVQAGYLDDEEKEDGPHTDETD